MESLYYYMLRNGYDGIQKSINTGPNGSINVRILNFALDYMFNKEGWKELDPNDYKNLGSKDMIKYITNNNVTSGIREVRREDGEVDFLPYNGVGNKFRSGGWVISVLDGDNGPYILYKPHNLSEPPCSVQISNIKRLFVLCNDQQKENNKLKPRKVKVNNDLVVFNRPGEETKFPVYLNDNKGKRVVVYYAKDSYKQRRFESTKKMEDAIKNGWYFND